MKVFVAATIMTLVAGAAFAGEGAGNPFPFRAPTQAYSLGHYKQVPGTPQNPYPFSVPGHVANEDQVIPPVGSAGEVQSANSMPRGFEDGTPVAQSVYHIAPSPTQMAQPRLSTRASHG